MQTMRVIGALLIGLLAAPALASNLDAIADDYVRLVLAYGEHEDGYVDAYYGPPEWAAAAKAGTRPLARLKREAARLKLAAQSAAFPSDPMERKRQRFLIAQLHAVETRIAMRQGAKLSFSDEAEALFGAHPALRPLESYDPIIAEVEAIVPGGGALSDRVEAFRDHYIIPADKLDAVDRAAIAECRARTLPHISLPANERFTLAFVTGKPWSGYNWYKGDAESLIEVNTDLPINVARAVQLGCHEGYPGHHTLNARLESELMKARGWREFSVYPLYSPQSLIAEGTANYGVDLAFPGDTRTHFEAGTLYLLAGLDPATAPALARLDAATQALDSARYTIADAYLGGRIDTAEALRLLQKYMLIGEKRARQSLDFIETYRSYIINYGFGRDLVQRYAEASGDPWAAFTRMISEPTLPRDLMP